MRESIVRQRIVKALKSLDAQAVENGRTNPGTPDVEFMGGWIEIKYLPKWPKRENTPVVIHHFTAEQRIWLKQRFAKGGKVLVLIRIADCYLLFDGHLAAENIGTWTQREMYAFSIFDCGRRFDTVRFVETIKSFI